MEAMNRSPPETQSFAEDRMCSQDEGMKATPEITSAFHLFSYSYLGTFAISALCGLNPMPEAPNPKLRDVPSPANPAGVSPFAYAELDVKTNFSFLRGASHPDELVYRAAELGYRAIAVTDFNSLAGVVRAHEAAKEAGIALLIGSRLTFSDAPDLLVWAPDRLAYARLCRLLTLGKRRAEKGECALELEDFLAESAGLLAAVVGNPKSEIRNPNQARNPNDEIRNLKSEISNSNRQIRLANFGLRHSDFGFDFRISDFEFRISPSAP